MKTRYEQIVNTAPDSITLINRDFEYELVNDTYSQALEKPKEEILRTHVADIWGQEKFESTIKPYLERCFSGEEIHYTDTFPFGPFEKRMHVSFYPYGEREGEITHALVFSQDISPFTEPEFGLGETGPGRHAVADGATAGEQGDAASAYRDWLTGLFNRRSLDEVVQKELEQAKRSEHERLRALLFISLKNFKRINQTHGHQIGDLLLENTGIRVQQQLRKSDYVFRFEGTNLVVLLTNMSRNTDAAVVARKLSDTISVPYRYRGTDLKIYAAIGVSLFPDDAQDREALIQHANSAVIEAEAHGEPFMLYNHDLHEAAIARLTLQTELQRAFEAEQFELYYQPIVDEHGIVLGAEGLIRWHHPERGLLKPSDFIELAEQTGTIAAIDKWALYSVSKQMADWVERYDLFCSLNISALEFSDAYLSHVVSGALSNAGGLDPSRLKLELTESRCMDDPDRAVEQIKALREQGIEVWIDDFGTGQSSLSYLKRLPAPVLKIDKVFVEELPDSGEEREYLSHIIGSVHARGKEIVVEGVATRDQMDTLSAMGCRTMQGYFFSEPLPADRFAALLEQGLQLPS